MMQIRRFTWILATLLGLLAGSAIMPASWVLAAPGDGYGPGTCGDDTTRACEATNSVLTVAVQAILAATAFSTGAGAVDATTIRTVAATNSPDVTLLGTIDGDTSTIAARTPALGQATMAASSPVVIASDQSAVAVDTELPAAAALTDADPNPTVPGVASHLMGWVPGGPAWERIRSSGTGAVLTDLQLVDGAQPAFGAGLTTANTFRVVNAVGTATGALVDPDQTDAVVWAANANRKSTICQVVGTTQVLVREGAPTGGGVPATACCGRFNGGTLANDGTGQWFEITSTSAVYLYDVAGAGNADVACTFEVYP